MAFPRKYQKVPLSVRDGDDDVQLASLRKRVETAADDVQLTQPPQSEEVEAESKQSMTVEKRYSVISTACQQIMRHKRLPVSQNDHSRASKQSSRCCLNSSHPPPAHSYTILVAAGVLCCARQS